MVPGRWAASWPVNKPRLPLVRPSSSVVAVLLALKPVCASWSIQTSLSASGVAGHSSSKTVAFLGYPTLSPGAHTTSKLSGLLHLRCVPFWLTVYIDGSRVPNSASMPGELERAVPPRREQCVGCSLPLTTQDYGRVRLRPPSRSSNCCSNQAMWAWMRGRRALAALPRRFFSDTSMATS